MIPIIKKDNLTYLVGETLVSRPLEPYAPIVCDFLHELSVVLLSSKESAHYPDVMVFALWCHKDNIIKLKEKFSDGKIRMGRGLAFHIAPSNVPVNFAFSLAFGFLAGNANIIRVSSTSFAQVDIICSAINKLLENNRYHEIKEMLAIVKYEQNDEITAAFSANCQSRIIWGGNATIRNIRKLPIPERAVEITFADRYSFCIIDAPSIIKLTDTELLKLAENFYNDNYSMDQNACASAHLIIWQGKEKDRAKERFWTTVAKIVAKKYQFTEIKAVDKYTLFCRNAIELDNIEQFKKYDNYVYCLKLSNLPMNMDTLRGVFGYFYEYDLDNTDQLIQIITSKYQTLTYFGIDKKRLSDFVTKNRLPGIDRIVPIGKALAITPIWDGYDVVKTLSRIIDIQ